MNEELLKLAKKSGIGILYDYDEYDGHAGVANLKDIEKFAQAIINDVLSKADDRWSVGDIKQHYGVKS